MFLSMQLHLVSVMLFQFAIDEDNAKNIMEVYTYDWTDEKL